MNNEYLIVNHQDGTRRFPDTFEEFSRLMEDQLGHGSKITVIAVVHQLLAEKSFTLCPYHRDSLGWHECSEFWGSTQGLIEVIKGGNDPSGYDHCQVDEARMYYRV